MDQCPYLGSRTGKMSALTIIFNSVLQFYPKQYDNEKKKGIQFGKGEIKLTLFAKDIIACRQNSKEFRKKIF